MQMKFATALTSKPTLLLLSEEPATLEIDQVNYVLISLFGLLSHH